MHSQDFEKRSLFHVQSESSIGRASMTLRELFLRRSQMNSIQKIILTVNPLLQLTLTRRRK